MYKAGTNVNFANFSYLLHCSGLSRNWQQILLVPCRHDIYQTEIGPDFLVPTSFYAVCIHSAENIVIISHLVSYYFLLVLLK